MEKRLLEQWYFRITSYAQPLLEGLDNLDWPSGVLDMQRHWLGRSQGCTLIFDIITPNNASAEGSVSPIEVFTTRPETVFGASFLAISAKHPLLVSPLITGV